MNERNSVFAIVSIPSQDNVKVIIRTKQAVLKDRIEPSLSEAFKALIEDSVADYIVWVNHKSKCDLQNMYTLVEKLDNDNNVVFIAGIKDNIISNFYPDFLAKFILLFPTKAFFKIPTLYPDVLIMHINNAGLRSELTCIYGQNFDNKIELLYRLIQDGVEIKQIDIPGYDEVSLAKNELDKNFWQMLKMVFLLRWNIGGLKRFLKFGIVGFIGFLVNAVSLEVFAHTSLTKHIAEAFSFLGEYRVGRILSNSNSWSAAFAAELSIISNFIWNNIWTFSDRTIRKARSKILNFSQFNATSIGAILIQFITIGFSTLLFGDTTVVRQITLVLSIAFLVVPYNWFMYNRVIWNTKKANE